MQSSLKLTRSKSDRLSAPRSSNLIAGLTTVVVLLPQARAFAAASKVEPKTQLYTAVVAGTVAIGLVISYLRKNLRERGVTSAERRLTEVTIRSNTN